MRRPPATPTSVSGLHPAVRARHLFTMLTPDPSRRAFLWLAAAVPAALAQGCRSTPPAEAAPPPAASGPANPGAEPAALRPAFELPATPDAAAPIAPLVKTPEEWRAALRPGQFKVLREQGTEWAFTGPLWDEHRAGRYRCAGCGLLLFSSADKFDSGTGWPSFTRPAVARHVAKAADGSLGMSRDEIRCARCGGHLGHVFDDGPAPTGLRYCMNSVSLVFEPEGP